MSSEFSSISFDMPKTQSNAIKVIGVGGGGSNAVNHMFSQKINGVDFVICNTDAQALENSPIPNKIQLGAHLTSGLGAGANPDVGAQAAAESIQEIQQMLSTHTKMVFITAGMGGGTGTGAAPIIAKIAKDMDILTVGIVTMPFLFEGKMRSKQAQKGVDELRKNVDSLIVINNNKLRDVYGNLGITAGYSKADEVLSTAAKGIAEVITSHYKQNIDLHDAKTVLSNSGTAIMGSAKESGENRAQKAIIKALDSPLLNDNKITGAKNVLLLIISGANEVTIDEIGEINDYIQEEAGHNASIIMGIGDDETLGDGISVTIVATGFAPDQQGAITNTETKKIVHTLEGEQKATYNFKEQNTVISPSLKTEVYTDKKEEKTIRFLDVENTESTTKSNLIPTTDTIKNITVLYDEVDVNDVSEEEFIITDVIAEEQSEPNQSEKTPERLVFDFPVSTEENSFSEDVEIVNENTEESASTSPIEKRYVLEDFDIAPTIGMSSEPSVKTQEIEESLQFEKRIKVEEGIEIKEVVEETKEVSPLSLTISELQSRAEQRRRNMKEFNHRFKGQFNNNVDDIERQPAYKRNGINLDVNSRISEEKTVLQKKNEDESLLKSNNSFLHDNVD